MHVAHPAMQDVYALGSRLRITFYDAAYLALALDAKVPFITLDQRLADNARKVIEVMAFDDAIALLNK
jgi:predicted nucleic acid-binding protein